VSSVPLRGPCEAKCIILIWPRASLDGRIRKDGLANIGASLSLVRAVLWIDASVNISMPSVKKRLVNRVS
jgi:hypothetical protein